MRTLFFWLTQRMKVEASPRAAAGKPCIGAFVSSRPIGATAGTPLQIPFVVMVNQKHRFSGHQLIDVLAKARRGIAFRLLKNHQRTVQAFQKIEPFSIGHAAIVAEQHPPTPPAAARRTARTPSLLAWRTLIIIALLQTSLWAAMPNQMAFEVRPGAGADTNSGGFATINTSNSTTCTGGTDWTQQNAAQVTFNGSTITATTAGGLSSHRITGYTTLSTDVCNTVRISGGTLFLTGLYYIVSVNTGTNTWTLDRTATSGAASLMTGTMGGAMATLKAALSDINTGSQNDVTVWYKSGTDTVTSTVTQPTQLGLLVHGYQTSRGDNTGTRPLLTTATNSTNLFTGTAAIEQFHDHVYGTSISAIPQGPRARLPRFGRRAQPSPHPHQLPIGRDSPTDFLETTIPISIGEPWPYMASKSNPRSLDGVNNAGSNYIIGSYIHGNGAQGVNNVNPTARSCTVAISNSFIASNTINGINGASGNTPWCLMVESIPCSIPEWRRWLAGE